MNPAITALVYIFATVSAAGIGALARHLFKQSKSQRAIHEAVLGRPAGQGIPELPSLVERFDDMTAHLAKQDDTLIQIEHEVMENNGSSIKDTISLMNRKLVEVVNKLDKHIEVHQSPKA